MNRRVQDNIREYVDDSEGHYLRQIDKTARALAANAAEKPFILISGPSGSGKTTTAFRLKNALNKAGFKTHALSMDNYFFPLHDPRNEREPDGSIDFESPKRLDTELLSEHLEKILRGEEIIPPAFDFARQERTKGGRLRLGENEFVVIEGIHSLNPAVTGSVSAVASGVYVSVRTRIKGKGGGLMHPSKIRLMRRLVRDKLFRGRRAAQTLQFFEKVERGEEIYIHPYKGLAEHGIDAFIAYETAVYKKFLTDDLNALRGSYDGFERYEELMEILEETADVDLEYAPRDSLVREFAGGSRFEYFGSQKKKKKNGRFAPVFYAFKPEFQSTREWSMTTAFSSLIYFFSWKSPAFFVTCS
jgi:uridine kinase